MSMRRGTLGLVLLVIAAGHAAGDDLPGRLFFTPAERARLDAARREAIANANRPAPAKAAEAPRAPPPRMVTLNGVVRRSDGETTVWVNGKAVSDRFGDADIRAGSITRDAVGLDLPANGGRVRLKVGQTVEATSGVIEEGYRRRRTMPVAASPAAPAPAGEASSDAAERIVEESLPPATGRRRPRRGDGANGEEGGDGS